MQQLDQALLALEQDGSIIRMAQRYGSVDMPLAAALTMAQQAVTTSDQHQLPKAVHARTLRAFFL